MGDIDADRNISSFMGTKEASNLWNVPQSTIARWCREGKIKGAEQDAAGSPWRIPKNTISPKISKIKE